MVPHPSSPLSLTRVQPYATRSQLQTSAIPNFLSTTYLSLTSPSPPHDEEAVTMRFPSLPLPLPLFSLSLLLLSPPPTTAQFTFPPPLTNGSLSSYLSGTLPSTLNVSAGDTLFGGWSTPGRLMSFLVYRCTGSTSPSATIEPLRGEEFNSSTGRAYPDKTWAQMPLYSSAASNFGNGFNPGRNPVWLAGEFFANNETTGALCWFELYVFGCSFSCFAAFFSRGVVVRVGKTNELEKQG